MSLSKAELRSVLEQAMEDVALLMGESMTCQQRLLEVRGLCADVWKMADLGDVPEFEPSVRVVKAG